MNYKPGVVCAACLCIILPMLCGCGANNTSIFSIASETYRFEAGMLLESAETEALSAVVDSGDTDDVPEGTVYWVKGGSVWHKAKNCSSLSRSNDIKMGTVEEATANGKTRVCKKCGN